jgi:hypothetical protein
MKSAMRWVLWWFAVFAAYVVTVVAQNGSEIVAGGIIAALCAIVAAAALRNGEPDVRVPWRHVAHLAPVPLRMLRDAFRVSGRIVWSLRTGNDLVGYLKRVPYDCGDRRDPWTMGREALVIFGLCAAPNTIVAEVDLRGELLIHQLIAEDVQAQSLRWPV